MHLEITNNKEYRELLSEIKNKIKSAQIKAILSVNKKLIRLYWEIGKSIVKKQTKSKWGDSVVDALAKDLKREFPDMAGFSRTNLFSIRQWYLFYSNTGEKVQQLVGQLPWGHNILLINKIKTVDEVIFYLSEAIKNNWSRNVLLHHIEINLYKRKGTLINNFPETLPLPQSDLAVQTLKDPYIFDFLSLSEDAQEKDIEEQLMKHITKFLLELGSGFSFVGRQYNLEIAGKDFFIDMLFYHLKLRCYVVIELKTGDFKPEYAEKLNFYLSAVDNQLKSEEDNSSIGIILCKTKNKIIVEYALRDMSKPMGVSEYRLVRSIPKNLTTSLPTVDQLKSELSIIKNEERERK
ncbi:DUF1016 domain-containing protein [Candidatus Woesearchaeota archaeon]|nr:DUF1016 domain-containing protein [Candidatus Woesearchaeota archaeon]